MKLFDFTGGTTKSDVQIQKSISHLLIIKTGTTTAIGTEKLSASLQNGMKQEKMFTLQTIRDLGVISQYGEGYIAQSVAASSIITTKMFVKISGVGGVAVELVGENYISLDFSNLESAATYTVYGFENVRKAKVFISYTATQIAGAASQEKNYQLPENALGLFIKNNDALAKIRLFSRSGGEVSYLPEELAALGREENGITQMADTLIEGDAYNQVIAGGASEFFFIPAEHFTGFEVTTAGGTDLTFVVTKLNSFN